MDRFIKQADGTYLNEDGTVWIELFTQNAPAFEPLTEKQIIGMMKELKDSEGIMIGHEVDVKANTNQTHIQGETK